MKKNDWILITATGLYSFLFYKESAGINFFIFSVALSLLLMLRDPSLSKKPRWLIAAAGTIISGAAVAYYGNWLSIWANLVSLALLSGTSISTRSSVIMMLFHSLYSVAGSMVFMILDTISRKSSASTSKHSPFYVRLLLVLVPLLITLLFFFLYRGSNPVFNNFAKNIHFDFITWSWVFFTLLGFILLYGFFYHRRIKELSGWDENAPLQLTKRVVEENGAGGLFSIRNQYLSGMILFAMLNILLLVVNALDLQYVYISKTLPPGLTHSENVHQGVELLILSIIIAIAIILFVFRGDMNFYSRNRMLRLLAYAWIIQNMFMVVSTIMRNNMYVYEHGLTYKRIGVYVYLGLALVGLITTWVKIMKIKSNWFLFRVNTAVWYGLLVVASLVSWDAIISGYNIAHARTLKSVDKNYLIELAPATLPEMLAYNDSTNFLRDERVSFYDNNTSFFRDFDRSYGDRTLESKLHGRLYEFFLERENLGWPSWNYEDDRTRKEVIKLSSEGKLRNLSLAMFGLQTLQPLEPVSSNVFSLDLASNELGRKLEGLALFRNLEKLNLSSNGIDSLDAFPVLPQLKELDISLNQSVQTLAGLRNAPQLTVLRMASCKSVDIQDLPLLNELTDLDISGNTITDIPQLEKYRKLQRLALENATVVMYDNEKFPVLPSLRKLNISNHIDNSAVMDGARMKLIEGAAKCINLEELNLGGNALVNIQMITNPVGGTVLTRLQTLNLQSNRLSDLSGVEKLESLSTLNVSYNRLHSLAPLKALKKLKTFYASYNPLADTEALNGLTQLEHLELMNVQNLNADDLRALVNLRWLNVAGTSLRSIEMLHGMKKMEWLYLQNNQLESIASIKELTGLQTLNISGNRIQDYEPLYQLRQLKELYIDPVPEKVMEGLQKALPNTKITVMNSTVR